MSSCLSMCTLQELELLDEDSNIYKLIGPVLIKQDPLEATSNVKKRLEFIQGELDRVDSQLKKLEDKQSKRQATVSECQSINSVQQGMWPDLFCVAVARYRVSGAATSSSSSTNTSRQQGVIVLARQDLQRGLLNPGSSYTWRSKTAYRPCCRLSCSRTGTQNCPRPPAAYAFSPVVNMSRLGRVAGGVDSRACLA